MATNSAAQLAIQLDQFGHKVNSKGGLADKLFTDTTTFNKLKEVTSQLQKVANNAINITENLNKASNKLNTTDNTLGVLLNDPKSAEQVKSIISNMQQSSVKLNEDLLALQNNFLLKGYFKKKEKAKADSLKAKQ